MRVGGMRHYVAVEEPCRVPDGQAGHMTTWNTVTDGNVWCDLQPLGGSQVYELGGLMATATHQIRLRYLPALTPACRIHYGDRIFRILSMQNVGEREREHLLTTEESLS